jgi:2-C-methyl-D-erythritol 4-phosphate cytidylyltransferase
VRDSIAPDAIMPMSVSIRVRTVVTAAGRGVRFGSELPKQFLDLAGEPVVGRAVRALAGAPGQLEIVVVAPAGGCPPETLRVLETIRIDHPRMELRVAKGGQRRQDSVAAGLEAFSGDCDLALIHDGARPFPPVDRMERLYEACMGHGGAIIALPVGDTVKSVEEGLIRATVNREGLWLAQTPQAIRSDRIMEAIALMRGREEFTDEAAVLAAMGCAVAVVEGRATNLKITRPEDFRLAEALLSDR